MITLIVGVRQTMNHRYIVGIDVALRTTGVVIFQDDPMEFVDTGLIKYKNHVTTGTFNESEDYYKTIKNEFVQLVPNKYRSMLFVIEGMPRYGHYTTAIKIMLARVNFYRIISEEFEGNGNIRVVVPDVYIWKKDLLGKANAGKLFTKESLVREYKHIPGLTEVISHEDTMDAGALALWGLFYGKG